MSTDFSVNRDEIIKAAMRVIRILDPHETPTDREIQDGAQALNMLVKQWQGDTDFSSGLKMWSRKRATLFLQKDQGSYLLGPTGDNWTASFVRTTLSANEALGSTVMNVASVTGITAADYVGVELNSGTVHWTTVSSVSSTVDLTLGIATAASSGKYLWAYTTKASRPIQLLEVSLRDESGMDTPCEQIDLRQYEQIGNKAADGDPTFVYYEAQRNNGVLYLGVEPSDTTKVLRVVYLAPIEDFDVLSDTPDYPQEWYRALKYGLAKELAPEFGAEWTDLHEMNYIESVSIAKRLNPETSSQFFEPNRE